MTEKDQHLSGIQKMEASGSYEILVPMSLCLTYDCSLNCFCLLHMRIYYCTVSTASVVWWLACWPLVPEFAGSIPTEAVGFFTM
jgi:hypothetical protein